MLSIGILIFLAGATFAITVGTVITQQQLDNQSEQQIRNGLEIDLNNVIITPDYVVFVLDMNTLMQTDGGNYEIVKEFVYINFSKTSLRECINDFNRSHCKNEVVKSKVISRAKGFKRDELAKILDWQTKQEDPIFTNQELRNLITKQELNE